ncbi:MAG: DUF1330 domain-containing protein [Rubritepida sp.]|jgi:uncharacterized protein (DUF1330 family)|nr:DUF1330 domain-containing protein [Rubritepida sp.]
MPAYLIGNITVTDPARYAEYRAQVPAVLAKHGGEFLVRGGAVTPKEGEGFQRVVVIRFPDTAAAEAFYHGPDYAPLLALRLAASTGTLALVEGVA